MNILNIFNKKSSERKREEYFEDAKSFIQVHFVRERGSDKYAFKTLTLKTDQQRDDCIEWYEAHDNPTNFLDIVKIYAAERKLKLAALCNKYKLDSKIFNEYSSADIPVEKWEAVAICLGLNLNISEARALLKTSGYALTNSSETDLAIRYCIENNIFILDDVNYIIKKIFGHSLAEIN